MGGRRAQVKIIGRATIRTNIISEGGCLAWGLYLYDNTSHSNASLYNESEGEKYLVGERVQ